jgi:hypothetical protein
MITVNDITEKLSLPKFDLPKVEVPKLDLPKFELPKVDVSRAADFARGAAYVGVGAVVLSAHAIDERRRTVTGQITGQLRKVVGTTA